MSLTCGDLIQRARMLYRDRSALLYEGKTFTFAEQAARMFRLANALRGKGIGKQQRVAILARNCSEYVEIFGACETGGFVAINLNSRLSDSELGAICQDCQPSVLIYAKEFAATARALAAQVTSIRIKVAVGPPTADDESYEDLLDAASTEPPSVVPTADEMAYLMYTSGTTGGAKGVMISHGAMAEAARMLSHEGGIASINKALIVMPLFHPDGCRRRPQGCI
jgi:acyl-CoA synthetase (AMP-forming)/AMP-acid ligase II